MAKKPGPKGPIPTSFKPGQSGNPSGRPKVLQDVRKAALAKGKEALDKVIELMGSSDDRVALAAAQVVLDRAYGKSVQTYADVTKQYEQQLKELEDRINGKYVPRDPPKVIDHDPHETVQ